MTFLPAAFLLIGLPLAGILMAGRSVPSYLEFPPTTRYVRHAPFSWPWFIGYAAFELMAAIGLVRLWQRTRRKPPTPRDTPPRQLPWWGWAALAAGGATWVLAWNRFEWFSPLQPHTFVPLWLSFIVVVNALCYRQHGHCLMCDRPGFFLALFPVSATFWWFFEYLNRFVQNWYYTGARYGPGTYFLLATMSFSTVLPAVLSVQQWLRAQPWIHDHFHGVRPVRVLRHRSAGWVVLAVSAAGLAGVGVWPDLLFPLLWVSPVLVITAIQQITGQSHVLDELITGDWRPAISAALAALVCGFFWEMWNVHSLAKWIYSIPYVQRFHLFEMPILGYAGYLPFGLECAAIGRILSGSGSADPLMPGRKPPHVDFPR